jgi:hypothetical protein
MHQPTMLRRLPWLVATAALTLLCVPRDQARADEKSDLIYKIEGRLRGAASALASLPSESSESPIDRAGDQVREAHGYADQLKQVAGDDSDARRIAENFRDIEDDWNDAAKQLRQLKGGQRRAEPVATACTTRDEELKRKANDYGRANDPDGLTELPRLAATAQDATRRELDELRSHDGRMDDYADDADDFRGDGPWRDLASATAAAAQQTYAVWRKSWEATQATCNNLTLGVEHPTVKQVLSDLSNSAGGRKAVIEQLNRDARDLGSALAGVSEDSGMGSVERAKSLLQAIERGIETLGRTATTDRETKVIVEKWPEGVRQLKEALDDLEDLKVHQHDMDPAAREVRAQGARAQGRDRPQRRRRRRHRRATQAGRADGRAGACRPGEGRRAHARGGGGTATGPRRSPSARGRGARSARPSSATPTRRSAPTRMATRRPRTPARTSSRERTARS